MIAELKNSKYSTMQEDAGDIDIATVPSTIIANIKDERISNIVSASASVGGAATVGTHLQPHHVVLKDESESSCGASESSRTNYKRKLMFAMGQDDDNGGGGGGSGDGGRDGSVDGGVDGAGAVGILEKDNMEMQPACKKPRLCMEKEQMFELFQPWALKTYGDHAKTKTITLRKKARILKALEGKEHSRPDSSKFRFWVKSKAFTTKRPECFQNEQDYPASSNTEYPNNIDLYVASATKDFGHRTYRKVAVVEEFFNIIYNIHVEMGGRSGRHAGQKRTYRIITETFAFLPREAVTRFLSACPECKKNLRPLSPGRSTADEDAPNESSTEIDVMNSSSQNDISVEISKPPTPVEKIDTTMRTESKQKSLNPSPKPLKEDCETSVFTPPSMFQKIRINPIFQTESPATEPIRFAASEAGAGSGFGGQMNFGLLNRESLFRYYDFMRRLYGQSMPSPRLSEQKPPVKIEVEKPLNPEPEAIDLTIDDEPTTSAATLAMHSVSVQEPPQQVCAINLSKSLSSYRMVPKQERHSKVVLEESEDNSTQLSLRKVKPVTSSYEYVSAFPELDQESEELPTQLDIHSVRAMTSKYVSQQESEVLQQQRKVKPNTPRPTVMEAKPEELPNQLDLRKLKPITSTYLQLTRSMGLSDSDALKLDDLEPPMPTPPAPDTASDGNPEDPYAGLMKDADKLKLMLLAWNYQNSNAVRNGTEGPDLGVVGGLWAQYQNALAQNVTKMETSISPVPRAEESSPMENQDETNSSGQKDEDEGSEDDLDDKLDQQAHDPERLKAFNMFVRLFVDENLDRIIPISKQPKEKIQAIIDSCARQFPEFSERSRKRIRTYLKSCRRNKKAREGWDNTTRPTPAHLTSVQAEQILAIACENESMNAKRMRIGLDPITQALPLTTTTSSTGTVATSDVATTSTPFTSGFRSTPNPSISESDVLAPITTSTQGASSSARSSPLALSTTSVGQPLLGGGPGLSNGNTTVTSASAIPTSSPLYRPTDFTSPSSTSPYASRTPTYPSYFPAANATPTDLSMKPSSVQQPTQSITSTAAATSSSLSPNARPPPPLVTHKLSANEITAARQVITAYRESAAFLLRTADQVEQLLVQQQ